jgi:hypothetical protein
VHLQPAFEPGNRDLIDPGRSLVLDHALIRQPQVTAFNHRFHQPVVLRFRSPGCRRARLSALMIHARLPACTSIMATLAGASASSSCFEIIRPTLGFLVRSFGAAAYYDLC